MLVLGILIGHYADIGIAIPLGLTLVSLLALAIIAFTQKKAESIYFGLLTTFTTVGLGILTMALAQPKNFPDHYSHQDIAAYGTWELKVTKVLKPTSFSDRYIAKVLSYNSKKSSGKVILNYPIDIPRKKLQIDNELIVFNSAENIKPPLNPHQFNYKKYLGNLGVYHQIRINHENHFFLKKSSSTIKGYSALVRTKIISKLKNFNFGKDEIGIIQALFLRQRDDISEATYSNYKDAGAVHILAVSGLHIGILLLFLEFLLRPLKILPKGKTIKLLVIVFFLWGFAFLAGLSASVVRAVTMFSFVAYALYLNRPSNTFNILALSMFFILLVFDPMLLFDVGFQMSYAAVFAIVWIYPLFQKFWYPKNWAMRYLWQLLSVSIAAQVGVLPISLYYFHQFPGLFFISNLLVVPCLGLILGFGITIIFLILLDIAPDFLIGFYNSMIGLMNAVIGWVAQQETFIFKNISFDAVQMTLAYCLCIASIWAFTKPKFKHIVATLACIMGLQFWSLYLGHTIKQKEIFFIGHQSKNSLLVFQKGNELRLFSTDTISSTRITTNYEVAERIKHTRYQTVQNAYKIKDEKLLIIDSLGVYGVDQRPIEYLLLIQSPKINLERLIDSIQPKLLIADGSNYLSYINRWRKTCANKKLPFHYTGEKGAFYFK